MIRYAGVLANFQLIDSNSFMSDHTKTLNRACLLSLYFLFFCSCTTHSKLQPTQNFQELSKPAIEVSDSCQSAAESYLVNRRCHSQLLSIEPGHYQFTLALKGINLEDKISENFLITIEQYDSLGNKIPVEVNYLKNTLATLAEQGQNE